MKRHLVFHQTSLTSEWMSCCNHYRKRMKILLIPYLSNCIQESYKITFCNLHWWLWNCFLEEKELPQSEQSASPPIVEQKETGDIISKNLSTECISIVNNQKQEKIVLSSTKLFMIGPPEDLTPTIWLTFWMLHLHYIRKEQWGWDSQPQPQPL